MARKKRIWYPGATYHVMSRGNRRYSIFKDDMDYEMFIECLKVVKHTADEIETLIKQGLFQQAIHVLAWLLAKE